MITTLHRGGTAKWLQYYIGGGMPKWLQYYIGGGGSLGTPKSDYVICARPHICFTASASTGLSELFLIKSVEVQLLNHSCKEIHFIWWCPEMSMKTQTCVKMEITWSGQTDWREKVLTRQMSLITLASLTCILPRTAWFDIWCREKVMIF